MAHSGSAGCPDDHAKVGDSSVEAHGGVTVAHGGL